jgi:hypothetical protein
MTTAERRQQEQRLVELFMRQCVANERNDRASADALFGQIWDVLAHEPERDHLRCRQASRQGFDGPHAEPAHVEDNVSKHEEMILLKRLT